MEKSNNPVNIRFVAKASDIRKLSENITSDVMLKNITSGNTDINDPELLLLSGGIRNRTAPLFRHKRQCVVETHFSSDGYYRCVTS